MMVTGNPPGANVRSALLTYFAAMVAGEPAQTAAAKVDWRMSCFDQGVGFVEYLQSRAFPIDGKAMLDTGCAWGGHSVAFAAAGAQVFASDLNDHRFSDLRTFCSEHALKIELGVASCEYIPCRSGQFDIVLALELVEHIDSVERFAEEVSRVLRPGGVCILSTPARLRSFIEGEPHYGIKGLTVLPLAAQKWVATRLFKRAYPYPIPRQYTFASSVIRPFAERGLTGYPVLRGSVAKRLERYPELLRGAAQVVWNFIVLQKPGGA